jgi:hypothetical protein
VEDRWSRIKPTNNQKNGANQPADIFTKALPKPAFERRRRVLMGRCDK